ncbi:MAG: hypothetical protein C5B57_05680 [Blastocatellia bacterium]|nr:MAG: hypothetical protein C5B57_05680 [Blastocatellia bacterium]
MTSIRVGSIDRSLAVLAVSALLSVPAAAQWLTYPTAGVPRLPDGKPNLSAPAPRTADGKPDLSGLWAIRRERVTLEQGRVNISPQMLNIGHGLEGGLPYQPWARALAEQHREDKSKDIPSARCLPLGPFLAHTYLDPRKIIQTPGLTVILNERDFAYRQIFTDGRPLPTDPNPSWYGYSTGHWDGDTLIVDTNGLRDGLWLDFQGDVITASARLTERFRRATFGALDIEVTIDDPQAYTRPWTVTLHQALMVDTELLEFVCLENEKDLQHFAK